MFQKLLLRVIAAGLLAAANASAHPAHRHAVVIKPTKTVALVAPCKAKVLKIANRARIGRVKTVVVATRRAAVIKTLPRGAVIVGVGPGQLYLADGRYYRRIAGGFAIIS